MKKIVLHNVFGVKNLGDEAIFRGCLNVINDARKNKDINLTIFCLDLPSVNTEWLPFTVTTILSPYGYIISLLTGPFKTVKKYFLFAYLTLGTLFSVALVSISKSFLPQQYPFKFITEIYYCDVFYGMGGGYLRTKSKFADYFGLLLTLIPIFVAKLYKKKIIFFPASFGDFASTMHAKLSYSAVANTTYYLRDNNSIDLLTQLDQDNLVSKKFSPDLALYASLTSKPTAIPASQAYIVLTARDWMSSEKQEAYENVLASVVDYAHTNYNLLTYFIPMATHENEDDDTQVFNRLQKIVANSSSIVLIKTTDPDHVKSIISQAELSICTRMHSAIFSATVHNPFIAIAYESKTNGFMKLVGMEEYVVNIEDVTFEKLKKMFIKMMKTQENNRIKALLKNKLRELQKYREELVVNISNTLR